MAFIGKDDLKQLYTDSKTEGHVWRENYPAFERLADNDLMEGMDENLPEVNDGSLAAALFKLPKRIVSSKLSGTVTSDSDQAWVGDLASIVWRKHIIPFANTQAPFTRKWKDAVRKAAIYGSVPIITLFVEKDGRRHADFIVAQPQDVTLEPGKVSDYDSDVMFWDVFYSKLQLENMIEQAKEEKSSDGEGDGYNKWDIPALEAILAAKQTEERDGQDTPLQQQGKQKPQGYKFCIAVQRGVESPFYMYYSKTDKTVREWSNPDPSGDSCIHFLYCYQNLINPYGIGIVKLAGGTQNVLDYMRQADVLATQLGLQPPLNINGNADSVDLDSLVFAQRAQWFTGNATVEPVQVNTETYRGLPERMSMYKTSLNQLIPTGDTSIQAGSGDPNYSKTPVGVKFQAADLSIDDEDFKDNLYITYAAVAKSMINTHFANMEGSDLLKLTDDEKELLVKGGLQFPEDTNELEIVWDTVRGKFDFEVDPEKDQKTADEQKLEGLTKVAEFISNPNTAPLLQSGKPIMLGKKQLDTGELMAEIVSLTTDNDKIITDATPDELGPDGQPIDQAQVQAQQMQEQAQAMQDLQKENQDLKDKLTEEQQVPYKDAPEDIKRQKEQRAGYTPSIMLSPVQEDAVIKAQQQAQAEATAQHAQSMDIVREHNTPDPMEMEKLKAKQKPKVAA